VDGDVKVGESARDTKKKAQEGMCRLMITNSTSHLNSTNSQSMRVVCVHGDVKRGVHAKFKESAGRSASSMDHDLNKSSTYHEYKEYVCVVRVDGDVEMGESARELNT